MPHKDRIKRYKTEGGAADLVRVEVLVPPQGRDAIVKKAAELRAAHRRAKSAGDLVELHREAVERFGESCLWNANPSATPAGMAVIADLLRKYGGMDAWRLAARIREALAHAAR